MKYNKGFVGIGAIIAIIAVLVVGGVVYFATKTSTPASQPQTPPTQAPQQQASQQQQSSQQQSQQQVSCAPNDPPSITVTNPTAGVSYTVGQSVAIQWTSCNVQNIWLSLASGGKDFGEITYPNPVLASQDSYQWTATDPAQAFTSSNTNNYQIVAQSQSPDVTVRSETFSVQ